MRALTISKHGTLDELQYREDIPVPEPKPGEVRVRLTYAAMNHLDLWVVAGLPGVMITPPWVLGADGTGYIDALGSGVSGIKEGDPVVINPGFSDRTCEYCLAGEQPLCPRFGILGEHRPGTFGEYIVVPAPNVLKINREPDEVAAAFTLATLTAWRMVVSRANVQAGEDVLIQGIGGGVAIAALQIAKSLGAKVWVTSSSTEKLNRAKELGADELLNYKEVDVAKEIRARTNKRGVNVVLDNVGPATWQSSLGSLGRSGRLVSCGGTTGPTVETDLRKMFWNQWTIMGSTMGNDKEFAAVVNEFNNGRLTPPVDSVYPLEKAREAYEKLQKGGQFGKIVFKIARGALD